MSPRRCLTLFGAVLLLGAAACVDDPVEPDLEIPLTEAEAELLGLQLFRQALVEGLEASKETPVQVAAGPSLAAETFTATDTATVACDAGGSIANRVTVTAVVDEEAGTGTLDIMVTQTHQDCQSREGDVLFHLDGKPNIALDMRMDLDGEGTIDLSGSLKGGVTAVVDYRAQTCLFDVTYSGAVHADGSSTATMSGTVCGEAVSQTVTEGPTTQ